VLSGLAVPAALAAWAAGCTSTASAPPGCGGVPCLDSSIAEDAATPAFDASTVDASAADTGVDSSPAPADVAVIDAADAGEVSDGGDATTTDAASGDASDGASAEDASDASQGVDAADGGPTVLATADAPYLMALGGGFVYWQEIGGADAIKRVPAAGGAVTQIASGITMASAASMAADDTNVYWTTSSAVYMCAHASTTPVTVASNQYLPTGIASDGTYVYWFPTGSSAAISRAPIAGGADASAITPGTLDTPTAIAFVGPQTFVSVENALEGASSGIVGFLPGDGGVPVPIASGLGQPSQLTTDGVRLYWVDESAEIESRLVSDGGALVYTNSELNPQIATDGVNLYYTDYTSGFGGDVIRRPVDAVTGVKVLYSTSYPWKIAVDATYVYWIDRIDNVVYRGAK
jgi:hypothetical protein